MPSIELDPLGQHADRAYSLLTAIVTPRPIAWVTTIDDDGRVNAAPFSFFNVFGTKPSLLAFAPGNKEPGVPKDTARNIRHNGEFVVHMVDRSVADAMVSTAAPLPFGKSELEGSGLTLADSATVSVPRIVEAPAALECKEHSTVEIGGNRLVIGIIQRIHMQENMMQSDPLRVDRENYHPIGRMASPDWYCGTEEQFEIPR
ncbi:flavin reductase family protein [Verrucomicrobiaceae bacterium 5K15]|uniref:Flavin reductase family protein n=1 Tax=Oceaniferula flava TaxID=2800421 RepID=A0AAE2SAB7_9BACT|nr:flavin reductase family protein [Oceaniferula flavus]MBK1853924.1 flavin reductase family protein [Oceaniferula flavus]MBM1135230.1 flavin reductase family protein [Oceaniferula flavus]